MRTLLSALIIMTMLTIAPSAMAGQPRPPDYLCLEWQSDSSYHHLSFRQIGRIYDKNFRIKTYAVTGRDQFGLICGSAYVERGTKTLLATYSGTHSGGTVSNYELRYELNTETGTIYYQNIPPDNPSASGTDTVNRTKCKKLNIPSKDDE